VNWIHKIVLHLAVLLIVIALQQRVDSGNVVNWIHKIVNNCVVLLIVVAVHKSG